MYGSYGASVQIPYVYPTKSGYTFKGWSTSSSSTTVSYQPGDYYTLYWSVTLYAVWQYNSSTSYYNITYNANGGTGAPSSQTKSKGIGIYLSSTKPTKSGYTFLGWSTSSTSTTVYYQPGDYYDIDADLYLYAVWEQSQTSQYCTITFDANGGTGAPSNQQKVIGELTYIPYTKPTRSGYTFLGWSTSRYATSADYQPAQTYTPYGDMTLYAVWEDDSGKMYLGYDSVDKIYIGNRQVTAAYLGTTKIW